MNRLVDPILPHLYTTRLAPRAFTTRLPLLARYHLSFYHQVVARS